MRPIRVTSPLLSALALAVALVALAASHAAAEPIERRVHAAEVASLVDAQQRIGPWTLGAAFEVDATRMNVVELDGDTVVYEAVGDHLRVDGQELGPMRLRVTSGVLVGVELHGEASGEAPARALVALTTALCEPHGGAQVRTPSPLGTPTPGEQWDPVILNRYRCEGELGTGVTLAVSAERRSASDFVRAELDVTLSWAPSAP